MTKTATTVVEVLLLLVRVTLETIAIVNPCKTTTVTIKTTAVTKIRLTLPTVTKKTNALIIVAVFKIAD